MEWPNGGDLSHPCAAFGVDLQAAYYMRRRMQPRAGRALKQSLKEAANVLGSGRSRAFVSRVAWLDLERLISAAFKEISENCNDSAELGNLYLTKNRDYPPFHNKSRFCAFNVLNQIQVHTGSRRLGVFRSITEKEKTRVEYLAESRATLWYSQDASGSVIVFVAPYKSTVMKMNEDNIILARYNCASSVSLRDVQRHFSTYFRYCTVSSVHGNLGVSGYMFRLRLKYGDIRYSTQMRASAFRYLELLAAGATIAGVLYTAFKGGEKLFS
jgi:hypothetical protein